MMLSSQVSLFVIRLYMCCSSILCCESWVDTKSQKESLLFVCNFFFGINSLTSYTLKSLEDWWLETWYMYISETYLLAKLLWEPYLHSCVLLPLLNHCCLYFQTCFCSKSERWNPIWQNYREKERRRSFWR